MNYLFCRKIFLQPLVIASMLFLFLSGCNAPALIYDMVDSGMKRSEFNEIVKRDESFLVVVDEKEPTVSDMETRIFNICTKSGYIKSVISKGLFNNIPVSADMPQPLQEIERYRQAAEKYAVNYIYFDVLTKEKESVSGKVTVYEARSGKVATFEGGSFEYFVKWFNSTFPTEGETAGSLTFVAKSQVKIVELSNNRDNGILSLVQKYEHCSIITQKKEQSQKTTHNQVPQYLVCKKRGAFDFGKMNVCITNQYLWYGEKSSGIFKYSDLLKVAGEQSEDYIVYLYPEITDIKLTAFEKKFKEPNKLISIKGFVYGKKHGAIVGTVVFKSKTHQQFYGMKLCDFVENLIVKIEDGNANLNYSPLL